MQSIGLIEGLKKTEESVTTFHLGLPPSLGQKKAYYAVLAHLTYFWCTVVNLATFSGNQNIKKLYIYM